MYDIVFPLKKLFVFDQFNTDGVRGCVRVEGVCVGGDYSKILTKT